MSGESGIECLLGVVARLRGENGCPWDREQTLASLKKYLVEECYELIDAIDSKDTQAHKDELGDVLLQVVLQAQIRDEEGSFDFDAVARHLADKMIRRHPHVFGDVQVENADDVVRNWGQIKAKEKAESESVLDDIPRSLPALMRADKIQRRAARGGFDWEQAGDVLDKIEEELAEVREALTSGDEAHLREELGDLLFAVVNLARFKRMDSEEILGEAIQKFARRFDAVRAAVGASGRRLEECSPAELDVVWNTVKLAEHR